MYDIIKDWLIEEAYSIEIKDDELIINFKINITNKKYFYIQIILT